MWGEGRRDGHLGLLLHWRDVRPGVSCMWGSDMLDFKGISTVWRWAVARKFARKLKTFAAFSSPPVKLSL